MITVWCSYCERNHEIGPDYTQAAYVRVVQRHLGPHGGRKSG